MGCFTGSNIQRYFNKRLAIASGVDQEGENDVMRCFEAARDGKYNIFAVTKDKRKGIPKCLSGRHAKRNLKKYKQGYGCQNGLGGQNSFDIYLVPGRAISGEYFPKSGI